MILDQAADVDRAAGRDFIAGKQVKAANLPAWSLLHLALYGAHLKKHAATRPGGNA